MLNGFIATNIFDEMFEISTEHKEHQLAEVHLNDVYIGSFSTAKNKFPMWTLYGDNSNGCCIVFSNSFFTNTESSGKSYEQELRFFKVHYINTREICEAKNDIARLLKEIAIGIEHWYGFVKLNSKLLRWIVSRLGEIRFLFKCDDYLYEDEVRLILRDNKVNRPFVDRISEVPKLFINVNNPVVLKEVILGAKVENPSAPAQFLLFSGVKKVTLSGITYR